MIRSDAPSCGVAYYCHSDDSRGVIYVRKMLIVQATGLVNLPMNNEEGVSCYGQILFFKWKIFFEQNFNLNKTLNVENFMLQLG
jgi:hypothetical protein